MTMTGPAGPRAAPAASEGAAERGAGDDAPVAIVSGSTEIRIARGAAEVEAAQRLRYRVFYEEMGAVASAETARMGRDCDRFDDIADHLLVIDRAARDSVVGTYRLTRRRVAERHGGFYTAGEYDISRLTASPGEIMELGRSCVDEGYRTRATMQLLWRGIAAYVFHHDIRLMFGCASLPGADPDRHAMSLSYLRRDHLAPEELRPRALDALFVDMERAEAGAIDARRALAALPPLIKGYLRLGGWVGDGAVVDRQFNTTDVCVVVRTESVADKYYKHYARTAREPAR